MWPFIIPGPSMVVDGDARGLFRERKVSWLLVVAHATLRLPLGLTSGPLRSLPLPLDSILLFLGVDDGPDPLTLELRLFGSDAAEMSALQRLDLRKLLSLESLVVLFAPLGLLQKPMVIVELPLIVSESSDLGGVVQSETEPRDGTAAEIGALIGENPVAVRDHVSGLRPGAEKRQRGPKSLVHVSEEASSKLELRSHQFPMDVDVRQMSNRHTDVAVVMENRAGQDRVLLELLSVVVVATGLEGFSTSNQQVSELATVAASFFRCWKRISLKKFSAGRDDDLLGSAEALSDDLVG